MNSPQIGWPISMATRRCSAYTRMTPATSRLPISCKPVRRVTASPFVVASGRTETLAADGGSTIPVDECEYYATMVIAMIQRELLCDACGTSVPLDAAGDNILAMREPATSPA